MRHAERDGTYVILCRGIDQGAQGHDNAFAALKAEATHAHEALLAELLEALGTGQGEENALRVQ